MENPHRHRNPYAFGQKTNMKCLKMSRKWRVLIIISTLLTTPPLLHGEEIPTVAVKTARVVVKKIGETLVVYGVLAPNPDHVLNISLAHAGLINHVWVRLGQRVKRGNKLLEVITAPAARMQYFQAESAVNFTSQELKRNQGLLKQHLATNAEVNAASKRLRDAKTSLNALRKRGLNHAKETLRASMDGIITQLNVAQGQRVQANTSTMLIAAEKRLIARLGVEPEDLSRIKLGTPVTITSVFVPKIKVKSQISEVHAMINPSTHLVEVLSPIPKKHTAHLVLGSRIMGHIHLLQRHRGRVVPRSAVLSNGSDAFVYIVKNKKAYKINVHTGIEQGNEIEIKGKIKASDTIVTLGNYELSDGMAIREAE